MNTHSFFPSNENPRPLASNERLKTLFSQGQEASAQVSLQKQYQESLTVDIRKGENQGRQVFSKSIEFSLGVKAESSYEFKTPSPKEVASTVLGFVENRINSEKSAGASTERLNNLLEQARSGIEKGYKQAEKDIREQYPKESERALVVDVKKEVKEKEVKEVKEAGLEVQIVGTELSAFMRRSELARDRNDQQPSRFSVGDKFDARVTQFDRKARRVAVSIKALEIHEEKEAVEQYGSTDSGASLGDILGAALRARNENQ